MLDAQNRVHFVLGPYDHTRPLVIDPVLVYSTYLGGGGLDAAYGIAVDGQGNVYVAGSTTSPNFPTENAFQANLTDAGDAFVAKLKWDASDSTLSLVYSTYLGGSHYDWGNSIAVDSYGNAYLAGITESSNFPTANPVQASLLGRANAFVAKIGTANFPGVAFGPGALSFGSQGVGTTSGIKSVTLTAAGSQPLSVTSITPSGDFGLANTATSCPYSGGTVPSATTCTIDVTFTPSVTGSRTGSLTITDDAGGSPQTVSLKGNFPTVTSLSPSTATAVGPAFTLTVTGTDFVSGSVVQWNGSDRTTTVVSNTELTAKILASDIATAGTAYITIFNPPLGGGKSNAVAFTINNPVPTAASLSPTSATAGGPAFTLTVTGMNFVSTSTVQWNGTGLATTYVSSTKLTASVPASEIATAGTARVRVLNPSPGGGPTSDLHFTINNPVPTATLLSPSSATAGGAAFTLTADWRRPQRLRSAMPRRGSRKCVAVLLARGMTCPFGRTQTPQNGVCASPRTDKIKVRHLQFA